MVITDSLWATAEHGAMTICDYGYHGYNLLWSQFNDRICEFSKDEQYNRKDSPVSDSWASCYDDQQYIDACAETELENYNNNKSW